MLKLANSTFFNNSARESSGVIYSKNIDLIIDNCSFENNSAFNGDAGVI
jgi:predicted outer membrane repeat protein